MAEKRMFTKKITESDAFLEMPPTTQNLYFHLNMEADDDGFVNSPKKIMKLTNATEDDMKILILKKFVILFENGVIVIKHWRMHNLLRQDRYHPTQYQDEFKMLTLDSENNYHLSNAGQIEESKKIDWQPNGNQMATEDRLDKDSKDKNSVYKRFAKPTLDEIIAYCRERNNDVDANRFYNYYEANGWKVGRNPMKDWKACVRTWERNNPKPQEERKKVELW